SGERFPNRTAISACGVIVISAHPAAIPFAIFFAAWRAEADAPGIFAARLNHWYSRDASPVNSALRCEPVRISPGQMVVTRMPFDRTSIPNPSENPTAANLLAQ